MKPCSERRKPVSNLFPCIRSLANLIANIMGTLAATVILVLLFAVGLRNLEKKNFSFLFFFFGWGGMPTAKVDF